MARSKEDQKKYGFTGPVDRHVMDRVQDYAKKSAAALGEGYKRAIDPSIDYPYPSRDIPRAKMPNLDRRIDNPRYPNNTNKYKF